MFIHIDTETIPSQRADVRARSADMVKVPATYKDEAKIAAYREQHAEEAWRKTALDGGYGEIIVIGWAVDDAPIETLGRVTTADSEAEMLSQFFAHVKIAIDSQPNSRPVFVGHNVAFDLRFLHHRAVVHGVRPPFWLPYNAAPWQDKYIDTMHEWCGARDRVKLTTLCDMLGILVTDSIDGSQVWDAYQAGDIVVIEEHCRADVERVRQIAKRLRWAA